MLKEVGHFQGLFGIFEGLDQIAGLSRLENTILNFKDFPGSITTLTAFSR